MRKVIFSTPTIQRVWRGHLGRKWAYRVRLRHVRIAWKVASVPVRQPELAGNSRARAGRVAGELEEKAEVGSQMRALCEKTPPSPFQHNSRTFLFKTLTKPRFDHLLPENLAATYTAAKPTVGEDGQPLAVWQGTFVPKYVSRRRKLMHLCCSLTHELAF